MTEDEGSAGWRGVLVRSIAPAAVLLALLLFLLLPVAGASCGRDDGGPAHLCYTGGQLISRQPSLDMSNILAGNAQQTAELHDGILNQVALPAAARALALITAIVLTLGVLSVAIPRPRLRATVATVTVLVGGVGMVLTEIVVTSGLSDGIGLLTGLFGTFGHKSDPAEIVSTEVGFWLALVVLVAAGALSVGSMMRLRNTAVDREFGVTSDDA